MALKVNYQDDVYSGERQYKIGTGTTADNSTIIDVTDYLSVGDVFGSYDINTTNAEVNSNTSRVTTAESNISTINTTLTTKANQTDLTALTTRVTTAETNILARALTPVSRSVSVATSAWSSGSATVSVTGVTSSSLVVISLNTSISDTAIKAYKSAEIMTATQGTGTVTLKAYGSTPTVALPLVFTIVN